MPPVVTPRRLAGRCEINLQRRLRSKLTTLAAAASAAGLLAFAGCGSSDGAGAQTEAAGPVASAAAKSGPSLKIVESRFGRVLADPKGEALYLFTKDATGLSQCYGECARAWPPYIVKRKPGAGSGVTAAKLGTTKRDDGRLQATYAGKPLYYYVSDSPGSILCQDVEEFGGRWYVIKPSGKPVL
ncbi:MAG: COG4315 family predicted lipoprotein [Solirubrobacterales bacterium]